MVALTKKYKPAQKKETTKTLRDQIILDYSPLVRFVAHKIAIKTPPNIEFDDLISSGVIGLIDAIEKYDPTRNNKFKTYAEFRIRGAILDNLRAQDWVPRSVREQVKRLERTNAKLEQELGRKANISEITSALGVDLESYHRLMNKIKSTSLLSVEEMVYAAPGHLSSERSETHAEQNESVLAKVGMENTKQKLVGDIELLPFNQQLILNLYYYDNLSLKEIAKIINLSESRVSQLHTKSINTLKGLHNKRKLRKK
jgi:RNA polymerase sigma factor FliA